MGAGMMRTHVEDHIFAAHPGRQAWRHTLGRQNLFAQGLEFGITKGEGEWYFFTTNWNFLAQRMIGPVFGHENTPWIGVTAEGDPHQVKYFALWPVCALK